MDELILIHVPPLFILLTHCQFAVMDPKPRLSCEQCRRRKTKCDKQAPCSSCKSAGLVCEVVQRDRLPRGKSGKTRNKGGLLDKRVSRIEQLLAQIQGISGESEPKPSSTATSPSTGTNDSNVESAKRLNSYVASDFWSVLSQEVAGLRETFDEASDDEASPPDLATAYSKLDVSSDYGKMIFGSSPSSIDAYTPPFPPNELRATLLATYKYRADSIYKLFHWPSMLNQIEHANANHHEGSTPAEQAVEFSIYCTAVCTVTDEEAPLMLPGDKSTLLQQYMRATEVALAQTNLMQRPDTTSLLAFVLYLNCLWACGKYATKWTLVAIAVRIGDALGLGREDPQMFTPFELECRRRLWYGVGLLDCHCTYDRGSFPLIKGDAMGPMPININDADMSPDATSLVPSLGFTDMAFSLLAFEAVTHQKRMCEAEDWETKLQVVKSYEDVAQRAIKSAKGNSPLEILNREGAMSIALNMALLVRRPPYKQHRNTVPESDDFDIMGCAVTILEGYLIKKRTDLASWEWKDWIPWYALAVVLAELCRTPTGPIADRAWTAARELYQRHARPASDLESGMLWKPLTKLMRRVQRERPGASPEPIGLRASSSNNSSVSPPQPTVLHAQNYAAAKNPTASVLAYNPTYGISDGQQQPLPAGNWTGGGINVWPEVNLADPMFGAGNADMNAKLYSHLDPSSGVSWLDWDTLMEDPSYATMIN